MQRLEGNIDVVLRVMLKEQGKKVLHLETGLKKKTGLM